METIILILALFLLIIIYLLIEKKQRNKIIKDTIKRMDEITDKYREEKIVLIKVLIKKMVKENLEDMEKTKIKDRISWIDGYLDAYTILKEQFNSL